MKILAVLLKLVNWLVDWSPGPRQIESTTRLTARRITRQPEPAPTRSILWTWSAGRERHLRVLEVPA